MKKIETFNRIYCNDLETLKYSLKLFKESKYGSTSTIYEYKNLLLKIFKSRFIKDSIKTNKDLMNTHLMIKNMKLKNLLKIKKTLICNKYFCGYTMEKVPGKRFYEIPDKTKIDDLKTSLLEVERDLKKLANNNIIVTDLNSSNILYDYKTNKSIIIDTDAYLHEINSSKDTIFKENMIELAFCIFQSLTKNIKHDEIIFNEMLGVLYNRIEYINNISEFIDIIVELAENYNDIKIKDIKTFRKAIEFKNNN